MKEIYIVIIFILMSCSELPIRDVASLEKNTTTNPQNTKFYPYRVESNVPHKMKIINNGTEAFYKRIEMIKSARETLELEYFIFNPDHSGRIIATELANAAKRKVKVRVLIDKSVAVLALDEFYAKFFKENNIEIRYYNAAPVTQIISVQFRNHRKLIVRDNEEAITGGRNIADEYFNLSEEFNFLDRDVYVKGEIVKAMRDSFENYWNSAIVEIPKKPKLVFRNHYLTKKDYIKNLNKYKNDELNAKKIFSLTEEDLKIYDFVMNYGEKLFNDQNLKICNNVTFATDKEGANFVKHLDFINYDKNFRYLRNEISNWIKKVDQELIADSPYFLNDFRSRKHLIDLLKSNKKVTILTNSLASTDATYVATTFNDDVKFYAPFDNFSANIMNGKFSNESELFSEKNKNAIWGTHSKTLVFNDKDFMVGTFNIDHRSNFYNSEMAIFCEGSVDLTKDIKDNIFERMKSSVHLNKLGRPDKGQKLLENTTTDKKIMYFLLKIPARLFKFLM